MALVLLDTSVWIDLLGKKPKTQLDQDQILRVATCPPIVQEVLQGIRDDRVCDQVREGLLALPLIEADVRTETYLRAADIYRLGRKRGLTIRSSADCLIAAIALEHRVAIMHLDRDFDRISTFTDLNVIQSL